VTRGRECTLRLEEKPSGKVYAQCKVETYPGAAVQTVSDSSRYFVVDLGGGHHVGLGFADRSDSFDLNVALQVRPIWPLNVCPFRSNRSSF